jgi:hypothetical protein
MTADGIVDYLMKNDFLKKDLIKLLKEYGAKMYEKGASDYRIKKASINERLRNFRKREADKEFHSIITSLGFFSQDQKKKRQTYVYKKREYHRKKT